MKEDSGQDLIEYSLLAAFISIASVAAVMSIGSGINLFYTNVNTETQALQAAL